LAVKRKTIFAALVCALLLSSMLGCGTSNHLQTITLTSSGTTGTYNLYGVGDTLQLKATGNYSSGETHDLTNVVTYTVVVDPVNDVDAFGNLLPAPPQGVNINATGMINATDPVLCTWVDVAPVVTVGTAPTPAWAISGDYKVTATFQGITSQPVFVTVASEIGDPSNPALGPAGDDNNPNALCGPQPTS
jgi:hypothetical protein